MSGDSPEMPQQSPAAAAASAAQADALQAQTAYLQSQLRMQNLLAPALFEKLGYSTTTNERGDITGIVAKPDSLKALSDEVQGLTLNREKAALTGNLPVDPQLSQELDRQEAQLHDRLRASLGPDYSASTPGIQALGDFKQRKANIIASAARGDITALGGLALNQGNSSTQNTDQQIMTALGIGQAPLQGISMFGPNAAGYGSIVQADNQLRSQQYQVEQQASSDMWGGIGQIFGTVAGIGLAPYTGGLSLAAMGGRGAIEAVAR